MCQNCDTYKVLDAQIVYVRKLFQESGLIKCDHVSKDFSDKPQNCNETAFSTSDASKKLLANKGSHEEGE